MRQPTLVCLLLPALTGLALGQNCNRTSTGLVPLTDMGSAKYKTFDGGLYGGGSNAIPAAHLAGGLALAAGLKPLDKSGKVDLTNGRTVVISIGMSNTTQEFSRWVQISNADPNRAAPVRVVDCAQGGQDARRIADPNAAFWTNANQRITRAGLSPNQVQVAWVKEAIARPTTGFPRATQELQGLLAKICQILQTKFPNIKLCYLSSRIYAGYATTTLNPEPYSYESGFAVKWVVEQQIKGDSSLNWDPNKGTVKSPWLAWGPYLWADGLKGRKIDSLKWECKDFRSDGTHPSDSGRLKVAQLLDEHFKNHQTTKSWYVGKGGGGRAAVLLYGTGCPGSRGTLGERNNGLPVIGRQMAYGITNARGNAPVLLMMAARKASLRLDQRCTLLVDLGAILTNFALATNSGGSTIMRLTIPNDPGLKGASVFNQFLVIDAQAPGLRIIGGAALSRGIELRIGTE